MFLYTLNLKIINMYKYINLFDIHSDTRNILVWIGLRFSSLNSKILNNLDI